MNQAMQIIPFFKATLKYQHLSTTAADSSNTIEELTATTDEAEYGSGGTQRSFSFGKEEGSTDEPKQKSKVRRLSKLRRLSKTSVSSKSTLRSSLVGSGSNDDEGVAVVGGSQYEGEMKDNGRVRGGSATYSTSLEEITSRSRSGSGSGSSVVEIQPIHRPKWLFAKRGVSVAEEAESNSSTLVIVQNPSRVDIQMAARCSGTKGTYRVGIPGFGGDGEEGTSRRMSKTSRELLAGVEFEDDEEDTSSEESEYEEDEDDSTGMMKGRSNSSSTVARSVEMTKMARRTPPPPPPPKF